MRAESPPILAGSAILLRLYRLRALAAWMVHKPVDAIRRRGRLPRLVPGELIVVTRTADARTIAAALIAELENERRFYRITKPTPLGGQPPRKERTLHELAAWRLNVRHGAERAMLLELELRMASALAVHGGYTGIDWRLAREAARAQMSAQRSRFLHPSGNGLTPSGPVDLTPVHELYRQMLCHGAAAGDGTHVVVLDTSIDLSTLPAMEDAPPVTVGDPPSGYGPTKVYGHGAAMVSIIRSVAPSASITLRPVLGFTDDETSEAALLSTLIELTYSERRVDVVVLCGNMGPGSIYWSPRDTRRRGDIERILRTVRFGAVVVTSTGNAGVFDANDDVLFPATCEPVVAVGAIDRRMSRPAYSKYRFSAVPPSLFVTAPGGRPATNDEPAEAAVTVGGHDEVGTSIAAAYAAGVVARVVSELRQQEPATSEQIIAHLATTADRSFANYAAHPEHYGSGMIIHRVAAAAG